MVSRADSWKLLHDVNIHLIVLTIVAGAGLTLAWRKAWTLRHSPTARNDVPVVLPLLATTASYLFFLACLSFPLLGSDYSNHLNATIGTNFVVALISIVLSLARATPVRWTLATASAALTLIWLLIGAISTAV
jgi:hypothetical protein